MSERPAVAIHIVTWNHRLHIAACLESVMRQTYQPLSVFIIDNGSVDGTVKWIEEHYPHLPVLRNTRNLGYCRAHNQGLRLAKAPYVMMLNPDTILSENWIERGVAFLDAHPNYGSYGGKLRRFSYSNDELKEVTLSDILDSTGLRVFRSRHAIDRGSGEQDVGQYDRAEDIFGHTGACGLFRRTALESLRFHDEYLDEDMFAYKDDIDLSWRLQRLGWGAWYDPQTVGHHHRHIRGQSSTSDLLIARHHSTRERFNTYYSYRNHWIVLFKHEQWATVWRDGLWIGWYEIRKFVFLLFTHPSSLRGFWHAIRLWPRLRQKARLLNRHSKQSVLDIRRRFFLTA